MRTTAKKRGSESITYVERVNRAIDYVVAHLAEPLNLKVVSRASLLSPFHFHRVFQALMGETVAGFVRRLRLERALAMMAHNKRLTMTQIAMASGFASPSDFSRCFKRRYGVAASRFDISAWREQHLATLDPSAQPSGEPARLKALPAGQNPDGFKVRIRELPARSVAYIRVRDPYKPDAVPIAAQRLVAWAKRHDLVSVQWLGYQWDDPTLTALEDCQYHVAVVAERFIPAGEVGRFRFGPLTVAEIEIDGGIDLEIRALVWLYGTWLPRSRYVPADAPCFEAWRGLPFAHGLQRFTLALHLPVKPA